DKSPQNLLEGAKQNLPPHVGPPAGRLSPVPEFLRNTLDPGFDESLGSGNPLIQCNTGPEPDDIARNLAASPLRDLADDRPGSTAKWRNQDAGDPARLRIVLEQVDGKPPERCPIRGWVLVTKVNQSLAAGNRDWNGLGNRLRA